MTHTPARRRAAGNPTMLAMLVALGPLAACDIPTSAPIVQQRWVVPSQSTRITVANLLPAGVTILADSSGFQVTTPPASFTRNLSQDCGSCVLINGQSAPKPAFTVNAPVTSALPTDIASATLTSGTLQVTVVNNYTFDPLRPSAAARGYAVVTVMNGTTVIGKDSVNGAQFALPPNGGTLTRSIALAGPVSGTSPITATLFVSSPAGDVVQMDASRTLAFTATTSNLRLASANVTVADRQVSTTTTIDLEDVDGTITEKVKSGALLLTVTNPFNVTGTLTLRFTTGATTITKTLPLGTGTTSPSVSFTQGEIQSLLGHLVTVTYSGPVSSTGGAIAVTPKQAVVVTSRLDLTIEVGG